VNDTANRILPASFVFSLLAGLILVSTFLGCSGNQKEPTGSLAGFVKAKGEAVGDCKIALYQASTQLTVGGAVAADGAFHLKEVPLGEYAVFVLQIPSPNEEPAPFDRRIPQKFRDPNTSMLSVTIEEGENEMQIDLAK